MRCSKSLRRACSIFLVLYMLMSYLLVPVGAEEIENEQSITDVAAYSESGDSETPGEGDDSQTPGEGGDSQTPGEGGDSETPGEGGDSETPGEGGDSETPGEGDDNQQTDEGEREEIVPFSCYTLDPEGKQLKPYWSEENSAWYLFVPSTQNIAETAIYYTGIIVNTTVGDVDAENGILTGAFSENGGQVTLTMSDETVHKVIVMQSELPSVHITLNGVTLRQVHADKNVKHKNNSISIMDPGGQYDLIVENAVEFKGRGNSTWSFFDKKAYQIKFSDKQSVLGMDKAKTWILLANAADETLMRNMLSLQLAEQLGMRFVTSFEYVDLWINGEYRGNYLLGEKVEMDSSRLDLEDSYGTLFEQDTSFYYDEDYWFRNELMMKYFTVKDTNVDDSDAAEVQIAIDAFQESLNELMRYLYDTPSAEVTLSELEKMIDVDSFVKYILVNEYCGNAESVASSFYSYKDGCDDVVHLGPVWDFDCSMGNYKDESEYYLTAHVLFNCLLACPEFNQRTQEIFAENRTAFSSLSSDAEAIRAQIAESIDMNFIRWNVWGQPNPKDSLKDYAGSYEEGYGRLKNWLYDQATSFSVQKVKIPHADVNEQCTAMTITFDNGDDTRPMVFAVWSDQGGQDDLAWYQAEKNAEGLWTAEVDLSAHNTTGKYTIHASTIDGNTRERKAIGYAYVDQLNEVELSAKLAENNWQIEIKACNVGSYSDVKARVWCQTGGDSDVREYSFADQNVFTKICLVELRNHKETGEYTVQLMGKQDGEWSLIDETTLTISEKTWPETKVKVDEAQKEITVMISNMQDMEEMNLLVWGESNGKNDAHTYAAEKSDTGIWTAVIDLDNHAENGIYQIEIMDGETNLLLKTTASVNGVVFSNETIAVYRLYNPNTHEHLLTANEAERDSLLTTGWTLDGVAWNASQTGIRVYRLYNPYDDWHTYSTSTEEIASLEALGWTVDGIVFSSTEAVNAVPVYRLFNPYEQKNYHLLTASEGERDMLLALGWTLDGVALSVVRE